MAIICSSTSGMAYDLYLTGSLHHSRTFYPPLQCFPALLHSVGGLCNHNPTSTDKGGYFLCVLSLLERLYSEWRRHLKQERNRRASCLGVGTVFCKSWTMAELLKNSRNCTPNCHWGKTTNSQVRTHCTCTSRGIMSWSLEFKLLPSKSYFLWNCVHSAL